MVSEMEKHRNVPEICCYIGTSAFANYTNHVAQLVPRGQRAALCRTCILFFNLIDCGTET